MKKNSEKFYDVIIIGAGPIGLMLGNLLGLKKINTLIIEKETKIRTTTRAIGITPPSLSILKKIKLDNTFIKTGVKVDKVVIHGTKSKLGVVEFNVLRHDYKFILSIPQYYSEKILESNLKKFKTVKLIKGMEAVSITQKKCHNIIIAKDKKNKPHEFKSKFLCGCDGSKSVIRNQLKIKFNGARYRDTFLMGDFIDKSGFKNEAHLFFTSKGPVESFPLPGGKRRWIVTTDKFMENPRSDYLYKEVAKRSGIDISSHKKIDESPFGVQHFLSTKYYNNRIVFCGDACHVMSPIGGQGMNTGFADAELCSEILYKILNRNIDQETIFRKYERYRKKAAITATRRAWISMRIGTIKGKILSALRNILIKILIVTLKNNIPPYFSMLTIPYSTLDKAKDILLLEENKL